MRCVASRSPVRQGSPWFACAFGRDGTRRVCEDFHGIRFSRMHSYASEGNTDKTSRNGLKWVGKAKDAELCARLSPFEGRTERLYVRSPRTYGRSNRSSRKKCAFTRVRTEDLVRFVFLL